MTLYIYLGGGPGEIKYKGHIIEVVLKDKTVQEHSYAIRPTKQRRNYIMIKIDKIYKDGTFPLSDLRFHGLKQFQRQSKAKDELIEYIKTKDID